MKDEKLDDRGPAIFTLSGLPVQDASMRERMSKRQRACWIGSTLPMTTWLLSTAWTSRARHTPCQKHGGLSIVCGQAHQKEQHEHRTHEFPQA